MNSLATVESLNTRTLSPPMYLISKFGVSFRWIRDLMWPRWSRENASPTTDIFLSLWLVSVSGAMVIIRGGGGGTWAWGWCCSLGWVTSAKVLVSRKFLVGFLLENPCFLPLWMILEAVVPWGCFSRLIESFLPLCIVPSIFFSRAQISSTSRNWWRDRIVRSSPFCLGSTYLKHCHIGGILSLSPPC